MSLKAQSEGGAVRLAQLSFLLMVLLLGWLRAPLNVGGLPVFPVDAAFLAVSSLWLLALVRREITFRFHPAYWLLLAYFVAMSLSLVHSRDPERTMLKLLTQLYLLALPVIAFNLVRTIADLKRVFTWWLAGSAAIAALGVATLLLFPFLGPDSILAWPIHGPGTLPRGYYPRLELTTYYPSTLAHYLGASLMLLLIGERLGWFSRAKAIVLGTAIFLSALFALTPGLGGILFMVAAWLWYWARERRPVVARTALVAGIGLAVAAVVVASVTAPHPTAPFLIHIPGLPILAPSVRVMAWIDALEIIAEAPLFGIGMGLETAEVYMLTPYCDLTAVCVADAHNIFLSIAGQAGIVGLAALCAIIWFVARQVKRPPPRSPGDVMVFGLAVAWISAIAVQGLVGAFEDTRHSWLLLGLLLSAMCAPEAHVAASQARNAVRP